MFSLFINGFPFACNESTSYLFADDGAVYFDNIRGHYYNIKLEIKPIFRWLQAKKVALHKDATKLLFFDFKSILDAIFVEVKDETYFNHP